MYTFERRFIGYILPHILQRTSAKNKDILFSNKTLGLFLFFKFIYFLLCWVFVAVHGLVIVVTSLVVEHSL